MKLVSARGADPQICRLDSPVETLTRNPACSAQPVQHPKEVTR